MIFLSSVVAWFLGTKAGRVLAAIIAGVGLALVIAWRLIAHGKSLQVQKQEAADNAAISRANAAGAAAERDGANKRLRDGTF